MSAEVAHIWPASVSFGTALAQIQPFRFLPKLVNSSHSSPYRANLGQNVLHVYNTYQLRANCSRVCWEVQHAWHSNVRARNVSIRVGVPVVKAMLIDSCSEPGRQDHVNYGNRTSLRIWTIRDGGTITTVWAVLRSVVDIVYRLRHCLKLSVVAIFVVCNCRTCQMPAANSRRGLGEARNAPGEEVTVAGVAATVPGTGRPETSFRAWVGHFLRLQRICCKDGRVRF